MLNETYTSHFNLQGGPQDGKRVEVGPCRHGWPVLVPRSFSEAIKGDYRYDEPTNTYRWVER